MKITTVGVIGAGTMGNGITQVCAAAGLKVTMQDIGAAQVESGLETISTSLERMIKKEKITVDDKQSTLANIDTAISLEALAEVDIVIEAATENEALKLSIFEQLDKICKADAILASNTSSISLTRIAGATQRAVTGQRQQGMLRVGVVGMQDHVLAAPLLAAALPVTVTQHREVGIGVDQIERQHLGQEGDRTRDLAHQQIDPHAPQRAAVGIRGHPGLAAAFLHARPARAPVRPSARRKSLTSPQARRRLISARGSCWSSGRSSKVRPW